METINQEKLSKLIQSYKSEFNKYIDQELYKWRAVAHFQKYWDIDAPDFREMLNTALNFKDDNLLVGSMYFPKVMLNRFCEVDVAAVKEMFVNLYNEGLDLAERINSFIAISDDLINRYNSEMKHYQDNRAISTYLWLKFPDKYFIYKSSCVASLVDKLGCEYKKQNKLKGQNIVNVYAIYNQIAETLNQDAELQQMLKSSLTDDCYTDPMSRTLAVDFGYYLDAYYKDDIPLIKNIAEENPQADMSLLNQYSDTDFLDEVYITSTELCKLKALLENKQNIILQGAPGVGKTFTAERLAYTLMGVKDKSRVEMVQFHQNYSYEDFIMGYKPNEAGGFELKQGVFYKFCKKAANSPEKDFFFIIDEINRGNLSKIFGELLMLIENSYRGKEIKLAYTDELFTVPKNLYIIGMMNTADRSLAMIDYALRRRFSFFEMLPGFESEGFKNYVIKLSSEKLKQVIKQIQALNEVIRNDESLGQGFCIGHSYFCNQTEFSAEWLNNVIEYDIEPMLKEYWFDEIEKYKNQISILRNLLK